MLERWRRVLLCLGWALAGCLPAAVTAGEVAELVTRSGEVRRGVAEISSAGLSIRESEARSTLVTSDQLRRITFHRHPIEAIERRPEELDGLEVLYYTNLAFSGQPLSSAVSGVQHDSQLRQRALAASPAGLSVRWIGQVIAPAEGVYRFTLRSQEPARLWVQAHCVSCIRSNGPLRESSGECFLREGQRAALIVEQSAGTAESVPQIWWMSSEMMSAPLSPRCLVRPGGRDVVSEITRGLLVTYFGNSQFEGRRLIRVERGIAARWDGQPPLPEMGLGWAFSAVWEGQVGVPISGSFRIAVDAEGGLQVTLNERPSLRRWSDKEGDPADIAAFPVFLDADRTYPIKVEYFNERPPARLRVYWYPSQGLQSPPFADRLTPAEPPDFSVPVDALNTAGEVEEALDRAYVVLTDGSRTPQQTLSATRSQLMLSPGVLPATLPLDLVARIQLSAMPASARLRADLVRGGVLLRTGDFLEGELQAMDAKEIRLSSILLGNHRIRREQVSAVYVRPLRASLPEWEVATIQGGAYRARGIVFESRKVILKGLPTGNLELPQESLLHLRHHSN